MEDVVVRLTKCFSLVFPDLREEDIPNVSMTTLGNWDSMASVTLFTVVEEEFGVRLKPADLVRFTSFASIVEYLGGEL